MHRTCDMSCAVLLSVQGQAPVTIARHLMTGEYRNWQLGHMTLTNGAVLCSLIVCAGPSSCQPCPSRSLGSHKSSSPACGRNCVNPAARPGQSHWHMQLPCLLFCWKPVLLLNPASSCHTPVALPMFGLLSVWPSIAMLFHCCMVPNVWD